MRECAELLQGFDLLQRQRRQRGQAPQHVAAVGVQPEVDTGAVGARSGVAIGQGTGARE